MRKHAKIKHATRLSAISLVSTLALLAGVAPAHAAEAEDTEILVTARGRAEALLAVPDTITVFDREAIAARKLESVDDIIAATPGVFIINDQDPGTNLISIRGVSTNRNQAPSIAYVVDGLALADPELFTLRAYDLAQVEVLKGPQGALFGRSASGGVIAITTAEPGREPGGSASIGMGNGFTMTADAAIDAPLSERVQLRLSGSWRDTDGFITNTFLNKKVDGFASRNLRAKLRAELSGATVLRLRAGWADESGGAAWISSGNVTGPFGGRLAGKALTAPFGDFEGRSSRDWWGVQASLESELGDGLRLSWTAGLDDYDKRFVEELDFR
ncbi:MAG TPA: TonB-dependent receptor plug domain-containing protein, partial [Novosphingobium sp.]|nr:TonB-dependent receptor plug domain-containing protein [Novosphingobium sp.]